MTAQTITEAVHCFLVTTRDPSPPNLRTNSIVLGLKWCSILNLDLVACHPKYGKEVSAIFGVVYHQLELKCVVFWHVLMETSSGPFRVLYSWHGPIQHSWVFSQILDESFRIPPDIFSDGFNKFSGSSCSRTTLSWPILNASSLLKMF